MLKKEKIAEIVAKMAVKAAKQACGTASICGTHQIKEPEAVSTLFLKKAKRN